MNDWQPPKLKGGYVVLVIRWTARVLGALLLALLIWLLVSDWPRYYGMPPLSDTTQFLALFTSLCGFVLIWRREGAGGLVATGGALCFLVVDYAAHGGLATDWSMVLLCLPGLLALTCWWLTAANGQVGPTRKLLKRPILLAIVLAELAAVVFLGAAFLWEAGKPRPIRVPHGLQYRPSVLGGPIPFTDEGVNKPQQALPNSKIKR